MIVVDASLVLDALLNVGRAKEARAALAQHDGTVCAPELLDAEVMQVLRRYVRSGEVTADRAVLAKQMLRTLPIERVSHLPYIDRAWDLGENMTAYDAFYVAIAEARRCTLVTTDDKFRRTPGHTAEVLTLSEDGE